MITTSAPRSRPCLIASNATAPGSAPSRPRTISQPARSAQPASCSTAAARNVSPAPSTTFNPSSRCRCHASLPIVVVLPVPLTPTAMITVGLERTSMRSEPVRAMSASISARRRLSASPPAISPPEACTSSSPTTRAVVAAPTSAMISASSRRSHVCSSTSPSSSVAWISAPSASRVLDRFLRSFLKKPRLRSGSAPCSADAAAAGRAPSVMKRSFQSRAMGDARR